MAMWGKIEHLILRETSDLSIFFQGGYNKHQIVGYKMSMNFKKLEDLPKFRQQN